MNQENNQVQYREAQETLDVLFEIQKLLNCGLDRETLSIIVTLIENNVSPVAVASIIKEIKNEHLSNS